MTRSRFFLFFGLLGVLTFAFLGETRLLIGPKGFISRSVPETQSPDFNAYPSELQSAKSRLLFSEEFNRLRLVGEASSGIWEPHFLWGNRYISQNGELQYYVDPRIGRDDPSLQRKDALFVKDGVLHLRASIVNNSEQHFTIGQPFISGMLSSARAFSFTYGYVEIRARMPKGPGLWPALWLLPMTQAWPPEIDIAEMIGNTPTRYYASLHAREFGFRIDSTFPIETYDLSERFSTFGMKWTREKIEWTFNGIKVAEADTPSDMHQPMYLLLNLAVGGLWGSVPDDPSVFPADFLIDYIRVYDIER